MKVQIVGLLAIVAVANAGVVSIIPSTTTLLRSPDTSVVTSERLGNGFAYSTVTGNSYTSVVQGFPSVYHPLVRQVSYIPQYYPQVLYHPTVVQSVGGYPGLIPTYPSYPGVQLIPSGPGVPPVAPGVNPENPIEVEDPADNAQNIEQSDKVTVDEDTVSVESA